MRDSNGRDGDGPQYPIKPLPGTRVSGPKWDLIPPDIYVLELKDWQPKIGPNGPMGRFISTVVLPEEFSGVDVAWFCNIKYDSDTEEFILAYGSKVARTARRLFPDDVKYCDPPWGRLLEHFLVAEVVTADKSRIGGQVIDKPKERQYSKVSKILAAGPRMSESPPSDQTLEQLGKLLTEWRTRNGEC